MAALGPPVRDESCKVCHNTPGAGSLQAAMQGSCPDQAARPKTAHTAVRPGAGN